MAATAAEAVSERGAVSEEASQANPKAMEAMRWHLQAEQLREEGNWEKAVEAYGEAIALNPEFSWSHHNLGNVWLELEDWQAAMGALERAIALNPEFAWSHYSLGMALAGQRRWEAAIEAYRRARSLEPQMEPVGAKLVEALEQSIRENPREVALYRDLAEERIRLGKFEEAIASYQMALQIEPGDRVASLMLAQLVARSDQAQAQVWLERAARVFSPDLFRVKEAKQLLDLALVKRLLAITDLFDADYYQTVHAVEVEARSSESLLDHYLAVGADRGYRPNPLFDGEFYLQQALMRRRWG
ncbi:MAG: tetratricopeptide repeat protein [Synechococcales cyanobacterium RU_4_20]|nr:tetratricopeptide repeat protein [Synechococcales cyanobacterium RU_4_20]